MRLFTFALAALLAALAAPAAAQDYARAQMAAADLADVCGDDRGRLWRVSLCGPLIVVDPATRGVWASQQDRERVLTKLGDGWIGTLPDGVPVANSSVEWAGVRWIMVLAPLPEAEADRRALVAHEAWHRVQGEIGFAAQNADNAHLETERGRFLMRLELRALASALRSRGTARQRAGEDALIVRTMRHAEFAEAAAQEAALDRNEGLAAYTGVKLGVTDNPDLYAARILDQQDTHQAFARAYAYASGPAYGLMLDRADENWRRELGARAPADVLIGIWRPSAFGPAELARISARYGGEAIAAEERARAEEQRARIAELNRRFGQGSRLELPLAQMQLEFDPNQITPVEGLGSIYGTLTLRDAWGEFVSTDGALIDQTFTRLVAAEPGPDGLSGPGWRLNLNPGWRLVGAHGGLLSAELAPVQMAPIPEPE